MKHLATPVEIMLLALQFKADATLRPGLKAGFFSRNGFHEINWLMVMKMGRVLSDAVEVGRP